MYLTKDSYPDYIRTSNPEKDNPIKNGEDSGRHFLKYNIQMTKKHMK